MSFPALLLALAVPRRGLDPAAVIERAIKGAPLSSLAAAAGVPLWLRRLPPEALSRPIQRLPDGQSFRRQIANHLPSRRVAPAWLEAVSEMADVADEAAAIWIARECAREMRRVKLDRLRLIGLWTWFSNRPGTFGHGLILDVSVAPLLAGQASASGVAALGAVESRAQGVVGFKQVSSRHSPRRRITAGCNRRS